ncbi:MAG: hypothetical protein V2B18_18845, partial [Pseudomonadota bacterium]
MDLDELEADRVILNLSREELGNMRGTLNEVCRGMRVKNFSTKMGADRDKTIQIHLTIRSVCDHMDEFDFDYVSVRLRGWELRAIIGAMQEICRELGFEFSTRMGVEQSVIEQMEEELVPIYDQMCRKQELEGTPPSAE